jgi:predicted RecA/RadA family phage recombinase
MATNKVQEGLVIQYTTGAAESYTSGDVVWVGGIPGVALTDIAVASAGSVALTGIWEVPKHYNATPASGTVFTVGDPVSYDIANERACKIAGYPLLGYCVESKTGDATTVKVLLAGHRDLVAVYAGETITAGQLLYVSSINANNLVPIVALADANGADPLNIAVLVAIADITNGALGLAGRTYLLTGQNTSAAGAAGDPVYLSATAGGWSLSLPATAEDVIQKVGSVAVDHSSTGSVLFQLDLGGTTTVVT